MSQNNDNSFIEKIRHLLSEVNIQTYLYALLAIGAIVLIVSNAKLGNKNYLVNKNSDTECRDVHGKIIKIDPSKGEGCVDIFGAAKDYGINIDNTVNSNNNYTNNSSNLTFDMSKDLVFTNIYLEQNGVTDPEEKGKILNNIVQNYKDNYTKDQYTINDLTVTTMNDKNSIDLYRKNIYLIIVYYLTQSKNIKEDDFDTRITFNNDIINNLLKIEATDEGANYQLKLINLLAEQNSYFDSINKIGIDPMKYLTLDGNNYMSDFKTKLGSIIDDFDNYFTNINN